MVRSSYALTHFKGGESITRLTVVCQKKKGTWEHKSEAHLWIFVPLCTRLLIVYALTYRGFWRGGLGEVAGAVVELQLTLLKFRIYDLDFDLSERPVAGFVTRRVGHQVLFAQVTLNLGECVPQILFVAGKVRTSAGPFGDFSQITFVDVERVTVADSDRINQRVSLLRAFDGFVHFHPAAGVDAVCQQYDCAACVFGGSADQFLRRGPNRVPNGRRSCETLIRSGDWRRSIHNHSTADVA